MGKCGKCKKSIPKFRARLCSNCVRLYRYLQFIAKLLKKRSKKIKVDNKRKRKKVQKKTDNDLSSISSEELLQELNKIELFQSESETIEDDNMSNKSHRSDFSSSFEELQYNLETQDSPEENYRNYYAETESDFESLQDFQQRNIEIETNIVEVEMEDVSSTIESSSINAENLEENITYESINEIELDSLLVKLAGTSLNFINGDEGNYLKKLKFNSKKYKFKSDSFFKWNYSPVCIGYLKILNYKAKILIWNDDELHELYNKLLIEIDKILTVKIKEENYEPNFIEYYLKKIARIPPLLDPNGKGNSIIGSDAILLVLSVLILNVPTVLYVRGSKLPISNNCNEILDFNVFLFKLINQNSTVNNLNERINRDMFINLQNRVDWAFNFYEIPFDNFTEEDHTFIINYIENYFHDLKINLVLKKKVKFQYHYFIENSTCLRGDIFYNNQKIGQLITYYHNSLLYRNQTIGKTRIAPKGLYPAHANILVKNSTAINIIPSYSYFSGILKNGLIRRIELRAFQFNELTVKFPILLQNLNKILFIIFNERKTNERNIYESNNRSEEIVPPSGFLRLFMSRETNINFNYMLLKNNGFDNNFKCKIKSLIKIYEKSTSNENFDIILQIIIEELFFIAFNGLRNVGIKYSLSNRLLEILLKVVINLDYQLSNICFHIERELKIEFNKFFFNEINLLFNEIEDAEDEINLNSFIGYNMVVQNFLFKEVYHLETVYRILGILINTNYSILNLLLEKESNIQPSNLISIDDLIYKLFEKIVTKVFFNQILCDLFAHFNKYATNQNTYRREWKEQKLKFSRMFKLTCSIKKFENFSEIQLMKQAFFNKQIGQLPHDHIYRQRNRNNHKKSIRLIDWVKDLVSYLSGKIDNVVAILDNDSKFLSSKMMFSIITYYSTLFKVDINIENIITKTIKSLEEKNRNVENSNTDRFSMILPEFVDNQIVPKHSQGRRAFIWVNVENLEINNNNYYSEINNDVTILSNDLRAPIVSNNTFSRVSG